MAEKVIAIIPARSGSKGLRKKNIQPLGGKPLIAWSIEAALGCRLVDRVLVSTDSQEFANIAKDHGADVPFLRPKQISGDAAKVEEALTHAISWVERHENEHYDIVVLLQTTDVFRNKNIIEEVIISLLEDPSLDTAFAAKPEYKNYWTMRNASYIQLCNHNYIPRQARKPIFREDTGVALATRVAVVKSGQRVGGEIKIIPHDNPGDFIDIHTEFDLWLANVLIKQRGLVPNT